MDKKNNFQRNYYLSETNISEILFIFAPRINTLFACHNSLIMYNLNDVVYLMSGTRLHEEDIAEIYCTEFNLESTFLANNMQDTMATYSYTLVEHGWLKVLYNGRELTLEEGDLYLYSPGFQISIVSGSEDYRSICLIADESMTLEIPAVRDLIRTSYLPIAEWGQPVVHVTESHRGRLANRMREIIEYQFSPHRFRTEVLRNLYTIFLLDLSDLQERYAESGHHGSRSTELFVGFMRLLPVHFLEHRDIGFYASELCITTTHLSRIVRQITGRTVMDYINQMLLMEALWLLQTTDLPITTIADRLHFANQSSFSKFFTRMKGQSPMAYRRG